MGYFDKNQGIGTENRYANDFLGNHIDRLKKESRSVGIIKDDKNRFCHSCGKKKPKLGGMSARAGNKWKCADCKVGYPDK